MENDNQYNNIDKKDIIYIMPAHQPAEEVELKEMLRLVWVEKYILVTSIIIFAAIGVMLIVFNNDSKEYYQGQAVVKVGEYLVSGGVEHIIDTEELFYRFGNLKPLNTVLNKKVQVEGLVKVEVSGHKHDDVKKLGDQTIDILMEFLTKHEQSLSQYWVALISPSQVLQPLHIWQVTKKDQSTLVFTSMLIIGLVIGLIIIFIKHSIGLRISNS